MHKFIAMDESALLFLVNERSFQSAEYSDGRGLVSVFRGGSGLFEPNANLFVATDSNGIFILGQDVGSDSRFLIIDLEQSGLLHGLNDSQLLTAVLKVSRFARKYWAGMSLSFSEMLLSGTSKAVVFPFSYSSAPFRMVLEREPKKERLAKRGGSGKYLLLYKAGHDGGDSVREEPGYTNFNRALEALPNAVSSVKSSVSSASSVSGENSKTISVVQLIGASGIGSMFRAYGDWMPSLTEKQREFVDSPLAGAHRIEGSAGTGKTLALVLRAIKALIEAEKCDSELHLAFITHSEATRRSIENSLHVIDSLHEFSGRERNKSKRSLTVCSLSTLCQDVLHQSISDGEFLDRDALESKGLQRLYIEEAIKLAIDVDLPSHERFLSDSFLSFVKNEPIEKLAQLFQHEFSVLIKGRASEEFHVYKDIPSLKYGLPALSESDKGFVFGVFQRYQDGLRDTGQFDTDDVVLSAIGQLDTPIWRRRRIREGFDGLLIDETHLFNINELHLFHFFSRDPAKISISYSVDRTQAIGDHGWTTGEISNAVVGNIQSPSDDAIVKLKTVFRSSPEIVHLAQFIVASGASLFTNFENTTEGAGSGFTLQDEQLAKKPIYIEYINECELLEGAFSRAEQLQEELGCKKGEVLIVSVDDELTRKLSDLAKQKKKPVHVLARRGDFTEVEAAVHAGKTVLGHVDYVGGLEFHAVVIVGADHGRLPPTKGTESESSRNYLTYSAHNRMYVAVSRARYRVEILGESTRGISKILQPAIDSRALDRM